jgi:hypothetical protein
MVELVHVVIVGALLGSLAGCGLAFAFWLNGFVPRLIAVAIYASQVAAVVYLVK